MSPPLYDGRKGFGPCRVLPSWCARDEANHIRDTVTCLDETVGAEVFGKRKHVPFRRRQGIEPAAAFVNDDDDVAVATKFDRAPGAFLEIDLPAAFLQQSRAANLFAQLFNLSLVHLSAPESRSGEIRPLHLLVSLVPGLAAHSRPAAKPAECKGALTNRQSPHGRRGEASLAAGMAPAAAGHPAQ